MGPPPVPARCWSHGSPIFGWQYGLALAAAQVGLCLWLAIDRGIVWLGAHLGITGSTLVVLRLITRESSRLTVDNRVGLTAGVGALVLAAGLQSGHPHPGSKGVRGRT